MARLVGAKLYPLVGPRRLAMIGTGGVAVVTIMFLFVGLETSPWWFRLLMFVRGLCIGFVYIPVQAAAFARVPLPSTGRASALFQVQRQVGAGGRRGRAGHGVRGAAAGVRGISAHGGGRGEVAAGCTKAFHQSIAVAAILGVVGMAAAYSSTTRTPPPR